MGKKDLLVSTEEVVLIHHPNHAIFGSCNTYEFHHDNQSTEIAIEGNENCGKNCQTSRT